MLFIHAFHICEVYKLCVYVMSRVSDHASAGTTRIQSKASDW